MPTYNDLQNIESIVNTLDDNRVKNFAYTDDAFNDNRIESGSVPGSVPGQNIPAQPDINLTVSERGYQTQAASITRDTANHFWGRTSFNLNKVVQKLKEFIGLFLSVWKRDGFRYDATIEYMEGDVCFTASDDNSILWLKRNATTYNAVPVPLNTNYWDILYDSNAANYKYVGVVDLDTLIETGNYVCDSGSANVPADSDNSTWGIFVFKLADEENCVQLASLNDNNQNNNTYIRKKLADDTWSDWSMQYNNDTKIPAAAGNEENTTKFSPSVLTMTITDWLTQIMRKINGLFEYKADLVNGEVPQSQLPVGAISTVNTDNTLIGNSYNTPLGVSPALYYDYTYIVDSNQKLADLINGAPGNDYSRVLIKRGEWSFDYGNYSCYVDGSNIWGSPRIESRRLIDLESRGIKILVGEPLSKLSFNIYDITVNATGSNGYLEIAAITGKTTPNGLINDSMIIKDLNVSIEISNTNVYNNSSAVNLRIIAFKNCNKLQNCHSFVRNITEYSSVVNSTPKGIQNISLVGFSECVNVVGCSGDVSTCRSTFSVVTHSNIVFELCHLLTGCSSSFSNSNTNYGFYRCVQLTDCHHAGFASTILPSYYNELQASAFAECNNLKGCRSLLYIPLMIGSSNDYRGTIISYLNCYNLSDCVSLCDGKGFCYCSNLFNCVGVITSSSTLNTTSVSNMVSFQNCFLLIQCRGGYIIRGVYDDFSFSFTLLANNYRNCVSYHRCILGFGNTGLAVTNSNDRITTFNGCSMTYINFSQGYTIANPWDETPEGGRNSDLVGNYNASYTDPWRFEAINGIYEFYGL